MAVSMAPNDAPGLVPWNWRPKPHTRIDRPVALVRLDGPDTLRFLHGQTSQAIESALPGQWLKACCVTPTARMRALVDVLVDPEGAWLVITAGDGSLVRQSLDRVLFPADRVALGPLLEGQWILPLDGDQAPPLADTWKPWEAGDGWWLGDSLLVRQGADLPPSLSQRPALTEGELERWRIQRGWPAPPMEINDDINPFELGLADRVHLGKGCYVGQETLAKLATYDGVRRQLRRWHCPKPGDELATQLAGGTALRDGQGERAGQITSSLQLGEEGWIGLALVRRRWLEEPRLLAGEGAAALGLELSIPDDFRAPPVGAGGGGGPG